MLRRSATGRPPAIPARRGHRLLSTCLATVACVLAATAAPPAHADGFLDQLAQARRSCAPAAPPLQGEPALDAAARQLAAGLPLPDALQQVGYRARRSMQFSLSGHGSDAAAAQALAQRQCAALGDSAFTRVGLARQGDSRWVVLAEPFAPPPPAQAGDVAAEVLALVNAARAQPRRCGERSYAAAPPLALEPRLGQAAAAHARSMAEHGYLEHRGRDGSGPADRVGRTGYPWRSVGENIAMGQTDARQVVRDWLASPPHCANLMEARYTQMGVAYAVNRASPGGIYWAQVFGLPQARR